LPRHPVSSSNPLLDWKLRKNMELEKRDAPAGIRMERSADFTETQLSR
jgi:hypothetical protein